MALRAVLALIALAALIVGFALPTPHNKGPKVAANYESVPS
ncbi:MAG TPA: hypothetical protein VIO94_05390 [Phenylobacterium sp.]